MGRRDVEGKRLHQPGQAGRLPFGQLQHQPRERRRVDDRVLQRAFQSPADQPGVEGIVAVLDQHGAVGKTKERPARIVEFGCPDQHRPVDVVPLLGIGIDWRPAIDERVEKSKRA